MQVDFGLFDGDDAVLGGEGGDQDGEDLADANAYVAVGDCSAGALIDEDQLVGLVEAEVVNDGLEDRKLGVGGALSFLGLTQSLQLVESIRGLIVSFLQFRPLRKLVFNFAFSVIAFFFCLGYPIL